MAFEYWVTLKRLITALDVYYLAHVDELPSDMPSAVRTLAPDVHAVRLILKDYDKTHKGGTISQE